MNTDPLLTEEQAAVFLGTPKRPYSVKTLQRHRLTGKGCRYVKIGKLVRYRQSDLESYIQSNVRQSTSEMGDE